MSMYVAAGAATGVTAAAAAAAAAAEVAGRDAPPVSTAVRAMTMRQAGSTRAMMNALLPW